MKAWDIIGYAYEADTHCVSCAEERFGDLEKADDEGREVLDDEGNEVRPIFASDMEDEEYCGDCGELLE